MKNDVLQWDFDINVAKILLVHQHSLPSGYLLTGYCRGRGLDGLVYCLGGNALFDFGESRAALAPGQLLFIPAGSAYTLQVGNEPFLHVTVNFKVADIIAPEHTAVAALYGKGQLHMTSPRNAELYTPRFERLLSCWQGKRNGYQMLSRAILYDILFLYFTDAAVAYRKSDEYDKIRPAKRYIDEHFADCISVADLAALCGLSQTHFRRLFSKIFGVSPTEYRLNRQMMFAKDYLLSGLYSVCEVAALAGFESANYFTRLFREREGKTPTEFMQG